MMGLMREFYAVALICSVFYLRFCCGQFVLKDIVAAVREIEARTEGDLLISNPRKLFHCFEEEERVSRRECVEACFLHDYFLLSYFPLFSEKNAGANSDYLKEYLQSFLIKDRQLKVDSLPPAVTYFSIFEDYILRGRPFKKTCENCAKNTIVEHHWEENPVFDNIYRFKSSSVHESPDLYFPELLHNHYLRRLFPSNHLLRENFEFLRSTCLDLPCLVESGSRPVLFQCPVSSHAVLWSASASEETPLTIQLLDPLSIAHKMIQDSSLPPLFYVHSNLSEKTVDSLEHFLSFSINESPNSDQLWKSDEKRFSATISLSSSVEMAFIPRQFLLHIPPIDSEGKREETGGNHKRFLVQCLIDASNLQPAVQSLDRFATLSESHKRLARELQSFLANDLLTSFHHKNSQQFTVFEKKPSELSFDSYFQPEIIASSPELQAETQATPAASKNNRKNRKKDFQSWQSGIQWKQLMYSLLLPKPWTVASASSLSIGEIDRRSVSLQWTESTFLPIENDQSKFGFKMVLCALPSPDLLLYRNNSFLSRSEDGGFELHHFSSSSIKSDSGEDLLRCEERIYLQGDKHLSSRTIVQTSPPPVQSPEAGEDEAIPQFEELAALLPEKEILQFTLAVNQLQPSTFYQVKVAMIYGTSAGDFSDWSPRMRTTALMPPSPPLSPLPHSSLEPHFAEHHFEQFLLPSSRPILAIDPRITTFENGKYRVNVVDLYFQPPVDDGGKGILGYLVYCRVIGRDFPEHWTYKGVYESSDAGHGNGNRMITVFNLMGSWRYEFKVVVFNEIGDSEYSAKSNPVLVPTEMSESAYHYFSFAHQFAAALSGASHLRWRLTPTADAQVSLNHRREQVPELQNMHIRDHWDHDVEFAENLFLQVDVSRQTITLARSDIPASSWTTHEVWRSHWSAYPAVLHAKPFYFNHTFTTLESGDFHPQALLEQIPQDTRGNFSQRVVFLHRTPYHPMSHLAVVSQSLGAVALVLSDVEGKCRDYSQYCLPGADKARGEFFAAMDVPSHWDSVKIPVFFILKDTFATLRQEMQAYENRLSIHHLQKYIASPSFNSRIIREELKAKDFLQISDQTMDISPNERIQDRRTSPHKRVDCVLAVVIN